MEVLWKNFIINDIVDPTTRSTLIQRHGLGYDVTSLIQRHDIVAIVAIVTQIDIVAMSLCAKNAEVPDKPCWIPWWLRMDYFYGTGTVAFYGTGIQAFLRAAGYKHLRGYKHRDMNSQSEPTANDLDLLGDCPDGSGEHLSLWLMGLPPISFTHFASMDGETPDGKPPDHVGIVGGVLTGGPHTRRAALGDPILQV